MKAAIAIRIRGWAECESAEDVAHELFGATISCQPVRSISSSWRVEDAIVPDDPVGSVRSVVTFECDEALEILIVPGSQGQKPPSGETGDAIVQVNLTAGRVLALDGRCWYRLPASTKANVFFWLSSPVAHQLC